jgi:CHAT domain-containing protein/Flp pilus assembly protein TadD
MGRTSCRRRIFVPLLFLLIGGTAAAPSAESLYRDAQAAFSRGDVGQARALSAHAQKRTGSSDSELAWRIRVLYADVLLSNAEYAQGREILQRALPSKLIGSEIEVLRLRGLSIAAHRLDDQAVGDALMWDAYTLAKKQPRTLANVLLVLATYDEPKSEQWAREAMRVARKNADPFIESRARGTLGLRLANQERFDEAVAILEPALKNARALGDESLEEKFEGNIGWCYIELGDYETANAFILSALSKATRLRARHDLVPWTFQKGNLLLQQGNLVEAQNQYRAAYDLAVETKHKQLGIVLSHLANAALLNGRIEDARRYADTLMERRNKERDPERAVLVSGRVSLAEGNFEEAERSLKDVLSRAKSKQTLWEAHGRLAQLYVRTGKAAAAEDEFRQAVSNARDARASVKDAELRLAFFTAREEFLEDYIDFLIARQRDADALNAAETIRALTLEEGLTDIVEPRDVRTIARDTNATILCYWLGNARSYLWIVTPKNVEAVALAPKRKIESVIDSYQKDLLGPRGSLRQSGGRGMELWNLLIEPAARFIASSPRIIIVPDGRMHSFNMETLVVPFPDPHYWIEDAVLSTAGSLGMLVHQEAPRDPEPRLLLIGDPPQPSREFGALPRAGEEIRKVEKHFAKGSAVILAGSKATPSAYRTASPENFTYLHFVAHGVAKRLKPLDSAIVLAREGDDFKLYAREIAKLPLHARLVTISSCHGAGTRAFAGEGLVGLGWAFLRAGADNVIAALWEVSDRATPDLMDTFYAQLVHGADPATALRNAKLSLVKKGGTYSLPRYWAPFLLYGSS